MAKFKLIDGGVVISLNVSQMQPSGCKARWNTNF